METAVVRLDSLFNKPTTSGANQKRETSQGLEHVGNQSKRAIDGTKKGTQKQSSGRRGALRRVRSKIHKPLPRRAGKLKLG